MSLFAASEAAAAGWNIGSLPEYSIGYVYLPSMLVIFLFAVVSAYFGARLTDKINNEKLKGLFAMLLFFIGVKFILP